MTKSEAFPAPLGLLMPLALACEALKGIEPARPFAVNHKTAHPTGGQDHGFVIDNSGRE